MNTIDTLHRRDVGPDGAIDHNVCRPLSRVSTIIPVGPNDDSWRLLLTDLTGVDHDAEVLLVAADTKPSDFGQLVDQCGLTCRVEWITTTAGRAHQMNMGSQLSERHFIWFLHADSRLKSDAVLALERSLATSPIGLHYFELKYQDDGPSLTRWNAWGARIRSQYFGLPFGDQGFCLSRGLFRRLGGFDEGAPYGEDHLLVWAAHRLRVPLRCVHASISTSARKFRANGWLPVTLNHGWRTCRQAIPRLVGLVWSRIR